MHKRGDGGVTDGWVDDVQTREGTVVPQMDGWTMCKQKGTVAMVSLMGNV